MTASVMNCITTILSIVGLIGAGMSAASGKLLDIAMKFGVPS